MIYAYPCDDGLYRLGEDRNGETFAVRDQIKHAGGRWDPERKHWTVTDAQRRALGIERMILCRIRDTHCGGEDRHYLPESQAVVGATHGGFCGHCDSRSTLKVTWVAPPAAGPVRQEEA